MLDTSVKYFTSSNLSAPVSNNNWGDIVKMLDACLVDGFSSQAISSVVVEESVVTLNYSTAHLYKQYQVLLLSGFDHPDMNVLFKIKSVTTNTVVIDKPSSIASGASLTGTIQSKLAPLGWEKPFSSTNKGAYRSLDPTSHKRILLVDNSLKLDNGYGAYNTTWAKWANVGIVEDMADINTIVGKQAPYSVTTPDKNWKQTASGVFGWAKWYSAINQPEASTPSSNNRTWILIGDSKFFYLFLHISSSVTADAYLHKCTYCFGDINGDPTDQYNTVLSSHMGMTNTSLNIGAVASYGGSAIGQAFNTAGLISFRDPFGTFTTHSPSVITSTFLHNSATPECGANKLPFPTGSSRSIIFNPVHVLSTEYEYRGIMPGYYFMQQSPPFSDFSIVETEDDALILVSYEPPSSSSSYFAIPISVKKSWRS